VREGRARRGPGARRWGPAWTMRWTLVPLSPKELTAAQGAAPSVAQQPKGSAVVARRRGLQGPLGWDAGSEATGHKRAAEASKGVLIISLTTSRKNPNLQKISWGQKGRGDLGEGLVLRLPPPPVVLWSRRALGGRGPPPRTRRRRRARGVAAVGGPGRPSGAPRGPPPPPCGAGAAARTAATGSWSQEGGKWCLQTQRAPRRIP